MIFTVILFMKGYYPERYKREGGYQKRSNWRYITVERLVVALLGVMLERFNGGWGGG